MSDQFCQICGTPLKYFPAGVSRNTGQLYEAFWGCPNKRNHPPKGQRPAPPPRVEGPPRAPQAPSQSFDSRERSIAAQACCKAACEAAAALTGVTEAATVISEHWIVNLAQRLFREVVLPAAEGKPLGPVTPPTHNPGPDDDIPF